MDVLEGEDEGLAIGGFVLGVEEEGVQVGAVELGQELEAADENEGGVGWVVSGE